MRVLFVIAEEQEAKPLIEHFKMEKQNLESINLWSDKKYERQLIVTGPGVLNVISSLSKAMQLGFLNPSVNIINVGYAGAKGYLDIGDVVSVKNCYCLEFPVKADIGIENCVKLSDEGFDCYTSFDFVEKNNDKWIIGSALFDMELAYIARFVYKSLHAIKIVSDNLFYDEFKSFDKVEVWAKAIEMVEEIIKRGEEKCSKVHCRIKQ